MQKFSKILMVFAVVVVVVLAGLALGWFASRQSGTVTPSVSDTTGRAADPGDAPPPPRTNRVRPPVAVQSPRNATIPDAAPTPGPTSVPAVSNVSTNWEEKLDEILGAEVDDTNKVTQLFALFRELPEEGREEVAQHLANLVEDENYAQLAGLVADPTLSEPVLDVLMSDLLNRPNQDKLPLLLHVARTPNHPKAQDSRELLELYLDQDFGDNWTRWEQTMRDWLRENPE